MNRVIIALVCLVSVQAATACTTFLINKDGQLVFGRNYDWITGSGMADSRPILETTIRESSQYVAIGDETKEAILNYTKDIKCLNPSANN